MKPSLALAALSATIFVVQAQVAEDVRRATILGSRGTSGKCTVEVRVDITAEVEIYGDTGRLRTLAGQPATWTRMECTDPLPYSMADFRFRGVDGRGNVRLVQDPRNNRGVAVIRIDDPKSGAEGYTFDIEWMGGSGGAPGGGFDRGRGGNRGWPAERMIDLCRSELRARAERDYGLRNIDITATSLDTGQGRGDWVTGAFNERGADMRRGNGYRFNCAIDFNSGQVRALEVLGPDGGPLQPGRYPGYDQNRVYRACQDAVIARTRRDGYQNVNFNSTAVDPRRGEWVYGTITASRGPVTDAFEFGCAMDFGAARVRNVEINRRERR